MLEHFKQTEKKTPEAGGIILGKLKSGAIHLLRLTPPSELDRATRMNFERHRLSAQIVINYEFHNSRGRVAYMGEWHTHPEDLPSPSSQDLKMIIEQLKNNKLQTDFLVLLIKGLRGLYVGVQKENELLFKLIKQSECGK
jgi:integrative and conjugative element protein (TIGR02256 family)